MGEGDRSRKRRSRPTSSDSCSETQSSPPSSLSDSDDSQQQRSSGRRRHRHRHRHRNERTSSRTRREKEKKRNRKGRDNERSPRRKSTKDEQRKSTKRKSYRDDDVSSEPDRAREMPESVLRDMLAEFSYIGNDLKQLLQMIDAGQAVDIKGITERSLAKHLNKLFNALSLEENGGVFLLPSDSRPVLEVVGPLLHALTEGRQQIVKDSDPVKDSDSRLEAPGVDARPTTDEDIPALAVRPPDADAEASVRRRIIGPAMPSAELLAAAAKLTEAQANLREAELEEEDELFIGPAPPAMLAEAESANEAERFEEVTRIMGADGNDPYDVVGANHNMSTDNIKKRYWKLSLLVHPDKCSHPEAQQAFVKLNKAFKELQDPEKRKAFDDKIKLKEEQEAFKAELRAMREAAQWRKLQGISMEGDEELLADVEVNAAPKRDEWMTTLPPEVKPGGMTMHSTAFSKTLKERRGDTSAWTDTPLDRAQKAKMNYLEAYNEATALVSNEEEKKRVNADAELVDMYNKAKRSKTLVQKHQEESMGRLKKLKRKVQGAEKEEDEDWVGKHPWKPWDREKDLVAGRQKVNFESESMAEGLSSRFSSGHFQRNFL